MPVRTGCTVAEALEAVVAAAPAPDVETVDLTAALGRTLAHDVRALADHPTVDNSALDGFACRSGDTRTATRERPVRLRVVGEVPAGRLFEGTLDAGEAVAIYTGAAVPAGADAIVPVEATARDGEHVLVRQPASPDDIRPRGQDLRRGDIGLRSGIRLDAASIALAAGMGHARVRVAQAPRVGILTTGEEIVPPGHDLAPGQVYDTNGIGLAMLVAAAGGEAVALRRVGDDPEQLLDALRAPPDLDLILTSGGVSMGRYDIVRDVMHEHGEVAFWKVLMKPGGPALFGTIDGVPLLGLPGNPVSSLVVFLVFGRAFVERSLGSSAPPPYRRRRPAIAGARMTASGPKETFARVRLEPDGRELRAVPTGSQSSGVLRSMAEADALAILPPEAHLDIGDPVEVVPLAPLLR